MLTRTLSRMTEDQDKTPPSAPNGDTPAAPSFETPAAPSSPPPAPSFPPSPEAPYSPPPAAAPPTGPPPPSAGPPPGGSFPPPGSAYPPPGGAAYGAPQGLGAPGGYGTSEERALILVAHFGGAAAALITTGWLGWVPPLIALLIKGNESPTVRAHAVEALNFQITWAIAAAIGWALTAVTCGILFFVPLLIMLVPLIFGIIGGVKALNGEPYRYPMAARLVK